MSNKTQLQTNNASLDECIARVNAAKDVAATLPEAGGGEPVIEALKITENGTYTATDGVDGYSPVTVNVPIPDGYIQPSGTKTITENGSYDVTEKASVLVDVPERLPILQEKTVTENGEVTPDAGYDGLSKVIVNVESSGGGGLPEGISALATGTIIPTSNITSDYTVTHNLGKTPDFAILMLLNDAETTALKSTQLFQMLSHKPFNSNGTINYTRGLTVYQGSNGAASNTIVTAMDTSYANETTVKFRALSNQPLKAGYTYRWIAGVFG